MIKVRIYYIFLTGFLFLISCITKPSNHEIKCNKVATVKNLSGLDGCGFILVLKDGTKLEPLDVRDKNFEFKHGQKVRIDYEIKEAMSICMVGKMADINCIVLMENADPNDKK